MGHSWWWRLVLACFLLVVVATSAEWDDNDDFAVDAATERFVERTKHEMAIGVEPKAKLAQQTTKNSTKLSSKGSSSNAKSSNAKKKRAQKKKKQQQQEELDEKTKKEKQLEETVERAVDMTPSIIPTKTFSMGGTKKSKLNKKEKKQKKTKKTTKQSKTKTTKKSTKATKKGKNSISTNEAELNYAYETTHTKAQYDAQIAKAKAQKRTLLKKLAAATAAQTKIPLYKQKLRQLTRKQTRAIAGKRKIQLAKKLKAEEKDEAVLKKAMADSRARYAKMVDAKMALDAEKKSTASELERLVTDVKLNWGR